jgi:hypothetical protein
MDEFVLMWLGVAVGSTAILIIWGLVALLSRRRSQKLEKIISSVEESWVSIDSMAAAFRAGRITADALRASLSEKIETLDRIYKPYIHRLDIYFVKYTEKRAEDYRRTIDGAAGTFAVAPPLPVKEAEAPESAERQAVGATSEEIAEATHAAGTEVSLPAEASASPAPEGSPAFAVEAPSADEEEPVISAMVEAAEVSGEEDELPLETFLEMETGTGAIAAEPAFEDEKSAVEPDVAEEMREEATVEQPVALESEVPGIQEYPEETMTESPFAFSGRVSSVQPPVQQPSEFEGPARVSQEPEETLAEAAIPFPERVSVVPEVDDLPPPPMVPQEEGVAASYQRAPAFAAEEVAQPATIYDIEAETIIADRNELFGTPKAAEPHIDKNSLGITGDDVSDMLDQFFGGKR